MMLAWVLLVAVAVSNVSGGRIVGGETTTISEYPWIVQVESRSVVLWSQSCAGNILTSRFLVSAAHCFAGSTFNINNRRIRAGTTDRNSGGVVVELANVVNHPEYVGFTESYNNDISLLTLAGALSFSTNIQAVSIPPQGFELPDGLPVVHAGWGTLQQGGSTSPVLRAVEIFTINRDLCAVRYAENEGVVTDNMICAGILNVGGKDACQGDSGGPLYYDNILVGVVSWGYGCADGYWPGISTRVAAYTDWIIQNAV